MLRLPPKAVPALSLSLSLSLSLLLAACSNGGEHTARAGAQEDAAPAPATAGATETPGEDGADGPRVPEFSAQEGWVEEPPSGTMRVAQYRLPLQGDDPEDAQLVVFHFPSSGTVEQNFQRWASQFQQPDGGDSMEAATRSERTVRGMTVHRFDVSGRYVAETFPGSGVRVDKPDWRLLGAIVESDEGPYYVKLTGPAGTVAHWESSFESFLSEI